MARPGRLGYVDWMRGFAVLLMMQTHAYDSWLSPEAKQTTFYGWSRLIGGYAAPLFLFLAGASLALAAEGRFRKGVAGPEVARGGARRGLEVLLYAALFRVWMFTTSGFARPADLVRVDVLNCIGLSMILVSAAALRHPTATRRAGGALAFAAAIALLTPLAWDSRWPAGIPAPLLAYVSGRAPGSFFPLFPWAGFTAAGAAAGLLLARGRAEGREGRAVAALAACGAVAIPTALLLDRLPQAYPRYDFWWTSPNYFLVKVGILLLLLGLCYAWGRAPWAEWPSALRQMGRTSLLVYWIHIEIVYGGIVAPELRKTLTVAGASWGLALLTLAMVLLSLLRTEWPRLRLRLQGEGLTLSQPRDTR